MFIIVFKTCEAELCEVQSNILRLGGMETLAQLMYSKEPVLMDTPTSALMDTPTSGVFNLPLMWSFEERMTIQRFSHLIEQKDERRNVPLLSELLKSVRVFIRVIIYSHIIYTVLLYS